jgi:hypothetical protein
VIVVLCHSDDAAALWLARALDRLGAGGIELVSVEQVVFSRRIVHRLSTTAESGAVHLADGRILRPETITGLVNRVRYLPTQHFAAAAPADRAYATAELSAFLLAWLNGAGGRVINPPLPFSLGGVAFPLATVVHQAAMAGLPTTAWRAGTGAPQPPAAPGVEPTHAAVVFDGRLFGALLPQSLQESCRRLALLLGAPLLQVRLHRSAARSWRFVDASGDVDFRTGGWPLASALARALGATETA